MMEDEVKNAEDMKKGFITAAISQAAETIYINEMALPANNFTQNSNLN
jgi:hypothetical protein